MSKKPGICLFCLALLLLTLAACQPWHSPDEPALPPAENPTQPAGEFATAHTVRLLTATPVETASPPSKLERAATSTQIQTTIPASEIVDTELPLLHPYLSDVIMSSLNTRVQIGFDFLSGLPRGPGTSAEIYDARLFDQQGGKIPLQSTTRVQPDLAGHSVGGIMTAVTLGEPVDRKAPLPVIPATVQFQITGDLGSYLAVNSVR
ncbi:MAG: hypothetical protein A2Z16_12270 [Chloroflexi bacterium RBG_16_54_18]|nr:MAG: hypothetical protein A2Z16_12270 [Chloroflexi bacterium RBG_16_54_18]